MGLEIQIMSDKCKMLGLAAIVLMGLTATIAYMKWSNGCRCYSALHSETGLSLLFFTNMSSKRLHKTFCES
jgi:hypothetical protein